MSRPLSLVLGDASRLLVNTQVEFANLLSAGRRTVQRWSEGKSSPVASQLHRLATLVHPKNPALAAEIAAHAGTTVAALGLETTVSPVNAELVLAAVADALDVAPRRARPVLRAALVRAQQLGVSVADLLKGLGEG